MVRFRIIENKRGKDRIFLDDIKTRSEATDKLKRFKRAFAGSGIVGRLRVRKKSFKIRPRRILIRRRKR